ncbi:MAG: cysteine desulfurase IscS [Candidatus Parcubacteria bacterium]|nr:MAG: cysteine desulfurase IscS [Candidatus Parcubacteria bacterium]
MKKIYFDYAATTFTRKEVIKAMSEYYDDKFGNHFSLHSFGQEALKALDDSREIIRNIIKANYSREIIFTSSATESNNLAIKGLIDYFLLTKEFTIRDYKPHIITTTIEHPSIFGILDYLEEKKNIEVSYVKPGSLDDNSSTPGLVSVDDIIKNIKENTVLISIHYVNSEIGVVQDIINIGKKLQEINKQRKNKIYFHIDAAQVLTENINVGDLNVDLMTLSSHKIYGPKGVAMLYVKLGTPLIPIIHGSEGEYGLRAGTLPVPLIVGFATALNILTNEKDKIRNFLDNLRSYCLNKLLSLKDVEVNNNFPFVTNKILSLYIKNRQSQETLLYLDSNNIAVSTGIACQSRASSSSYIIKEVFGKERADKTIRVSFGLNNTEKEVDYFINILNQFISKK